MTMGILHEYVIQQADKKDKQPKEWLENVIGMMDKCKFATHVGKFTHPDSKVNILDYNNEGVEGYVTTGGLSSTTDIAINAAYLSVANLLLLELENNKTVFDNILDNNSMLNEELSEWNIDILSYRVSLKEMMDCQLNENTEEVLKQVYFPLGNNEYKILTVMSPSSILVKLGNKLKKIGYDSRECRNDKSERYGEDHCMIFNQSKVGFGGTKPQNISTLNSKAGGSFYMLESLPPKWKHIDRLPKINFFDEIIYRKNIEDELKSLNRLFNSDYNNKKIRDSIAYNLNCIIDKVMNCAYDLQEKEANWSKNAIKLPMHQKIWLDNAYIEERNLSDEWILRVANDFSIWLIRSYEKICQNFIMLSDNEKDYFAIKFKDVLQEEVRYR